MSSTALRCDVLAQGADHTRLDRIIQCSVDTALSDMITLIIAVSPINAVLSVVTDVPLYIPLAPALALGLSSVKGTSLLVASRDKMLRVY